MNRRNFLKTTGIIGLGVFAPIHNLFSNIKTNTELDDLYRYLESKTINTPIQGVIPFKLYPFQKDILKAIHENDKLVIVKCRQIGMTTLLAGYVAWLSHQRDIYDIYLSPELDIYNHYQGIKNNFGGKIRDWRKHQNYLKMFYLGYFDEENFGEYEKICPDYWGNWINEKVYLNRNNQKLVICGSVDDSGHMKKIVDLANNNPKWKVLYYPWGKCYPMWDMNRIYLNYLKHGSFINGEWQEWCRELNCEFYQT